MKNLGCIVAFFFAGSALVVNAQTPDALKSATAQKSHQKGNPADTEVWGPLPEVVTPGKDFRDPPSDAIILFDGKNLDQWVSSKDGSAAKWIVSDGVFTVNKVAGDIQTKRSFTNYQLHIEFLIPSNITGSGQGRGNSGVFLAATNGKAGGYEIQVLDGYNNENKTYVNGMVGSAYKESIPLVNPARKAGEWNVYDIVWKAPTFNIDSTVKTRAKVTVFFNGVLVQNDYELLGETAYLGKHEYVYHGPEPIKLQDHGDPVSYRNIWVRELK
ncbi:DUF1080 domain-containing protein [Ginsengibacter hankyongi]|uniref:DUF1080 domain-containing protein n=1 Tax=Ginsengibacter hankyongi TaxID=2607284 RepID=A0A5J5I9F4_9BACT|nr:DUF1080 domain-containing protein [Ginsengibacter hankyongi]KAA9034441.1 DUF1080 domain-containing protein [Ginsengibacter hankyongi]